MAFEARAKPENNTLDKEHDLPFLHNWSDQGHTEKVFVTKAELFDHLIGHHTYGT